MSERLAEQIRLLAEAAPSSYREAADRARTRLAEGRLSRGENRENHFSVFFIAYDPVREKVLVGRHKKSDLWIPNGGHIEKGEGLDETLEREIREEWGMEATKLRTGKPALLTVTEIDNHRQFCKRHYDVWYFIPVDMNRFKVDKRLVEEEFHELRWMTLGQARELVIDPAVLEALNSIESRFQSPVVD